MKKILTLPSIGILALAISACTMTRDQYENARVASQSPAVKAREIQICTANEQRRSATHKANLSALMGVSVARVPQTYCRRLINAMVAGRISYEDYRNAMKGGNMTGIIRVLQGR